MHVGALSFSDRARLEFNLDKFYNKQDLIDAVRGIQYMDSFTNTQDGILTMRTKVMNLPDIIIDLVH